MKIHIALGKLLQDVSDKTIESAQWFYEIKIDGIRAVIFSDGTVYSRYGNRLYVDLDKSTYKQIPKHMVVDCEILVSDVWTTMALKSETKTKQVQNKVKIYAFDLVDEKSITKGTIFDEPYESRKQELKQLIAKLKFKDNRFIYVASVKAKESSRDYFVEIAHTFYKRGFEGAMFKKQGHLYVPSRTSNWIKAKVFADIDVKVVDLVIVNNRLKALVCEHKKQRFHVGTGFTEEQRKFIADHKDWFVGKTVNIKSMHYTHNQIPRAPVFVGFYEKEFTKAQAEKLAELKLLKPQG